MQKRLIYVALHSISSRTAMASRTIHIVNALNDKNFNIEIACLAIEKGQLTKPTNLRPDIPCTFYGKKTRIKSLAKIQSLISFLFAIKANKGVILYIYGYHRFLELYFILVQKLIKGHVIREITEYPGYNNHIMGLETIIMRYALEQADLLVVISTILKDYFSKLISTRIEIMNIVVDASQFELKHMKKEGYISYCGNLYYNKDGIDRLIIAYSIFKESMPKEYRLRLIGYNDNKKQIEYIFKLIRKYGIEEYVIFTGSVEANELNRLLVDSDLLVLCRPDTRQNRGSFPTKLGEFLASGSPVVVTDVGDISHFIIDGNNGYLSKSDQPIDISNKMIEAANNYKNARQIGIEGRKLSEIEFNANREVAKLEPYLKSMFQE